MGLKITHNNKNISYKRLPKVMMEEMQGNFARGAIVTLTRASEQQAMRSLIIAAIFFQRVVSRTPYDEEYTYQGKTKIITHEPDKDYTRDYWEISYFGNKETSAQLKQVLNITFDTFNNISEIKALYKHFYTTVISKKNIKIDSAIEIKNIDPMEDKYETLEYGGYKTEQSSIKIGVPYGYEHGVKNHYSIQAPHGMLRMTVAEMSDIINKVSAFKGDADKIINSYLAKSSRLAKVKATSKFRMLIKKIFGKRTLNYWDLKDMAE